ncbi:MAG TPA: carbon monoxide dehydrogenase subunit G [Tepidiformaceae bacterium]|nr:carbon monoxide dehydrogenase subunit G [Tepidiformaceae bacterium]
MEVSGDHKFAAPRAAVWAALLDPRALQASMPGCEKFEEVAPQSYDLVIKVGIAAIKGTYAGNVTVTDPVDGESYRLVVDGRGKPGSVQGAATLTLIDDAGGTLVKYLGDVKAHGAIARLGSRLLGGAAKLMIGQFMKAMEKQVEARS